MQRVQNAAARLLTESSKPSHVTLMLIQQHWLHTEFRVRVKDLVLTFRALLEQAQAYISELL